MKDIKDLRLCYSLLIIFRSNVDWLLRGDKSD